MADAGGSPRYTLPEAARCIWQGRGDEAVPLLEALAERVPPGVESVRLRYLATAHNLAGRTTQASGLAREALRAAQADGDAEEQARAKALLGRIAAHATADEDLDEAITLLEQCVQACDDGTVVDDLFHFGCLVDLAHALGSKSRAEPALAALERAIALSARFSDPLALATLYNEMAEAHLDRGDAQTATMYKQKCVQVHEEQALSGRIATAVAEAARLSAAGGEAPAGDRA